MNSRYPKISVIIITYNQEKIISRAINSVINQIDYVHELIISDDCSLDNTGEVIQKYQEKYPSKIKFQRHKHNLGIYENLESTYHLVSGELIFFLSGDDAMGEGLLKSTCELLKNKDIDYEKDKLCVLTDYMVINPDGKEVVRSNALVEKYNPFSLKYRGIVNNRALGETKAIFEIIKKLNLSKLRDGKLPSSLQEGLFDILPFYYAERVYYIPIVGNIYFSEIGVSSNLKKGKNKEERLKGLIDYCEKAPIFYDKLSKYDINWLHFHKVKSQYLLYPKLDRYIKYLMGFYILSKDPLWRLFFLKELKIFIKSIQYLRF